MNYPKESKAGPVVPSPDVLVAARTSLVSHLPDIGLGLKKVEEHLDQDIVPALSKSSQSPNYYGFVTGGATPAASLADHLAVDYDQNVQVHLPNETVATDVEDCALRMLCQLLRFDSEEFSHRTFTTGATASNILGLACGRQYVLQQAFRRTGLGQMSAAEHGTYQLMRLAGIEEIQVLTTVAHSSLRKAASITGLGRRAVIDVSASDAPHRIDLAKLEEHLLKPSTVSIVAISCAEVNTGFFATTGEEFRTIRQLCDQYGAWIHVDGAFGLLASILPNALEYEHVLSGVEGLQLADSITGDAHKLFNVPYDCGFFLSRHLSVGTEVFQNPNAAYLNAASGTVIPSPLNIGIENSRRFRALPVYATLAAYGREGYADMIVRQVRLARAIAEYIVTSPDYELLPRAEESVAVSKQLERIYIIVLFRARNEQLNKTLVQRVNATRKIYVSGTVWDGEPAARFAVANWQVDVERDLSLIKEVLSSVLQS